MNYDYKKKKYTPEAGSDLWHGVAAMARKRFFYREENGVPILGDPELHTGIWYGRYAGAGKSRFSRKTFYLVKFEDDSDPQCYMRYAFPKILTTKYYRCRGNVPDLSLPFTRKGDAVSVGCDVIKGGEIKDNFARYNLFVEFFLT